MKKLDNAIKLLNAAHWRASMRKGAAASNSLQIVQDSIASWLAAASRQDTVAGKKAQTQLAGLSQDCIEGNFEYTPLASRRHMVIAHAPVLNGDANALFSGFFPRLASVTAGVIDTTITGPVPSQLVGARQLIVPVYAFDEQGYCSWLVVVVGRTGKRPDDTRTMSAEEVFTMASAYDDIGKMFLEKPAKPAQPVVASEEPDDNAPNPFLAVLPG